MSLSPNTIIALKAHGASSASWRITIDESDASTTRVPWASFASGLASGSLKSFLTTTFATYNDFVAAMADYGVVVLMYGNGISGMPDMTEAGFLLPGTNSYLHLRIVCSHSIAA